MVNKADFSASFQLAEVQLLVQELLNNDWIQGGGSFSKMGSQHVSLPSKIAQELLTKEPFQKGLREALQCSLQQAPLKFSHLVTVLPSLISLPTPVVSMLKRIWEEGAPIKSSAVTPTPHQEKGEVKAVTPSSPLANPLAEETLSVTLANVKTVLSILYYFSTHIDTLKPESFDALHAAMRPLIDQLIRPVKKNSEGELQSRHRELPTQEKVARASSLIEKKAPLPADIRQKPDKALSDHKIDRNPIPREPRPLDATAAAATKLPRIQEEGSIIRQKPPLPSNSSLKQPGEERVIPPMTTQDRTSLLAAPFTSQYTPSTAPHKKKKKDPREQGEEPLRDEEDPFQEENF